MAGLAWYWWVLIVIGVIAIGYLKLKVLGKIMQARKNRETPEED